MEIIPEDIQRYAEEHTSPESDLLRRINRDTHAHVLRPRMLSGHLQGRLLAMMSNMIRPHRILEIGTYTGYSALCLSEGLSDDGKLITIDINEELEEQVRSAFLKSGNSKKIEFLIGDAVSVLPTLTDTFDLVFIDADKENYGLYFDLVFTKVNLGGIILADNVLWSGKVISGKKDKDTQAILDFNRKIQLDQRVENLLLPVRDGIMMIRKVSL